MSQTYIVQQGDCTENIAYNHGFFWETVWNHSDNASLKQLRKDPNVLLEGDKVVIPELTMKDEAGATEQKHRFKLKGVPSKLYMRFLRLGQPRDGIPYRLKLDGNITVGKTDSDGAVKLSIPPNAASGQLTLGSGLDRQVFQLSLGELDPLTEIIGVQQRLNNLGFSVELTNVLDDGTRSALGVFQQAYDLEQTGEINDNTRSKLNELHGC